MVLFTFARREKKFLISSAQYDFLMQSLSPYLKKDAYGDYTLCNLYYDTDSFDLIRRSLDGPVYKEKLRVRSYGTIGAEDPVFVELKKKYDGIVYKRRIKLPYAQAIAYLDEGISPPTDSQIKREIDYTLQQNKLHPAVYLAYDREAYFAAEDPGLRVTFDRRIRCRTHSLSLSAKDEGKLLLPPDQVLLELKLSEAMPLWLSHALDAAKVFPTSFSKYGTFYKQEHENLFSQSRYIKC